MSDPTITKAITDALAAPFDPQEVKWKPSMVKNNRCLAIAYVSARTVMDRLDHVLGLGNWQATYRPVEGGVVCSLRVRVGGEWTDHEDVGSLSEQPDEGDRVKAAFSDALKRAAVHVGVSRYLYRLPPQWVDYDPAKKQIVQPPQMPAWALPAARPAQQHQQPAKPAVAPQQPAKPQPANGDPLHDRAALDALLARKGKEWQTAIAWLAEAQKATWNPRTVQWDAVPEADRKVLTQALVGMPTVATAGAQS